MGLYHMDETLQWYDDCFPFRMVTVFEFHNRTNSKCKFKFSRTCGRSLNMSHVPTVAIVLVLALRNLWPNSVAHFRASDLHHHRQANAGSLFYTQQTEAGRGLCGGAMERGMEIFAHHHHVRYLVRHISSGFQDLLPNPDRGLIRRSKPCPFAPAASSLPTAPLRGLSTITQLINLDLSPTCHL